MHLYLSPLILLSFMPFLFSSIFFFFNDTATTEIYTLSLHDALPISLQPHLQLAGDRAGQLVLRRENVLHLPIVGCRPAGRAVARVDESDLEAKPRADPPESALEDVGHAKAVGDTPHVDGSPLEPEDGGAGDHAHLAELGENPGQLLGHAISQSGVAGVGAEIREREYGDRGRGGGWRTSPQPIVESPMVQREQERSRDSEAPRPHENLPLGRGLLQGLRDPVHGCNESVAATRQRLHEPWALGRIVQGSTELVDCCVEANVEFDKRAGGPNRLAQVLTRHHFAGVLQEQGQDPKGLLLQPDLDPALAQLACVKINLEHSEPHHSSGGSLWGLHEVSYRHPGQRYGPPASAPSVRCARNHPSSN